MVGNDSTTTPTIIPPERLQATPPPGIEPSTSSVSLGRIAFGVAFVILTFGLMVAGLLVAAMLSSTD